MTRGHNPRRLPLELIIVGLLVLLVAWGLTALSCDPDLNRRATEVSFNALVCPGTPPGSRGPAPAYYFLFSRLFLLWLLGAGTLVAGLALGVRDRLRGRKSAPVVNRESERKPERPRPAVGQQPPVRTSFQPRPEQRSSEPMAALRFDLRQAVNAGDLDKAIDLGEGAIADSDDPALIEAARAALPADIDWTEVAAAAIEADVTLKQLGEQGCGAVVLALGSLDENRLTIAENYHAPELSLDRDPGRPRGRRAPSRDRSHRTLRLDALEPLAAIERKPVQSADRDEWERNIRASSFAGALLVLRFLDAVRRPAAETGLPFPVLLHAQVESVGGEDGIRQRDPFLGLDLACRVAPIGPEVVERLGLRYQRQLEQWRIDCETTLANFRKEFVRTGYVHSRFIPRSMPEYERFHRLERQLAIYEPQNRVSKREFDAIVGRMATVMADELPPPIDPTPYLS